MIMTGNDFSFGSLLRTFRNRRQFTQQQLAETIGVTRRTLGRWERGDSLPASKALVLELARSLKLDEQETRQLLEASLTACSPYWSVPLPRNPYFTGREEILETLHRQLGVGQAVALTQSLALHGLGGIGKTQIALEYAYRHALEYSAVFWIAAETEEQIISSLRRIAKTLQLPEQDNPDQQRVVAAVQRWLSAQGQWLMIWDNVEDLKVFQRFLPSTRSGAILLTTRRQALGTLAWGLNVLPMGQEEGMLFVLRRAKVLFSETTSEQMRHLAERLPVESEAVAELVTILEGLPLALDQAGAYLEATRCGLAAYLKLFRTHRATLLQLRGEGAHDHPASVSTTLTMVIGAASERHPAVQDLLRVCALLQADTIPEELFRQGVEPLGVPFSAICRDPLEWNRVVGVACSYSLLSRQPEAQTFSLHRLVQAVLLDTMTDEERERWNTRLIDALEALFPNVLHEADTPTWEQCEHLLPHVLLCLHRAEQASVSLPPASLAYKTACYLLRRGQYVEAERLYQRALQIREQALGPKHPEVATSLGGLAILFQIQGKYTQAEPLYRRALQIREQALGSEHPSVAAMLNNLAILSRNQGKYTEAEPPLQRALQIEEHSHGPEHPRTANVLANLAELYWEQGRYTEAEPLLWRALQIKERTLGPDSPEVAEPLYLLANLFRKQGRYTEAEPLCRRALQIGEQTVGSEHSEVAEILTGLANLLREQGLYAEAEPLYQRALQIGEQTLGSEHLRVTLILTDLAECSRMQGRDREAEHLYRSVLQIQERVLGAEHPKVADPLHGLANIYRDRNSYAEAEPLYRRALLLQEQKLGRDHPDFAATLHSLALLRQKQGKLNEACALAQRALTIRAQVLGDAHPKTSATRTLLAQLVQDQEDGTEPPLEQLQTLLKVRGWSFHLKRRRGKPYVYATRRVGMHTQSRYLAPLSNPAACLAAVETLPSARE